MAQYTFDVSLAAQGVCPRKLSREIKQALALPKRPKFVYAGPVFPGTDNLSSGSITFTNQVWDTAQQVTALATVQAHLPCPPNGDSDNSQLGVDLDELEDYLHAPPGTPFYVRDLPRLTTGVGTMVYRNGNGFRRFSNDEKVTLP